MNLKDETILALKINGKEKDDVLWVGCREFAIPTDLFWELADQTYDNWYGSPEVAIDLVVVGDGFWLERETYDGAEWWRFVEPYQKKKKLNAVKFVIVPPDMIGNKTLSEMNEEGFEF